MNTYTKEVEKKLNVLLVKTYDAEKGFKVAADTLNNKSLKDYFSKKAAERCAFSSDLEKEIKAFNTDNSNTLEEEYSAWMNLKSLFSFDDEESVLEEAIRAEKASLQDYKAVLTDENLPSSTKSVLESQKNVIENGLYSN